LYGEGVDLERIEVPDETWTYVACPREPPCDNCGRLTMHENCLIIATDGACRNNGFTNARASVAVYVGEMSQFNVARILEHYNLTSQEAELAAGVAALRQAIKIKNSAMTDLSEVVIKTDSDYLAKSMTEWVFKWRNTGYRTSKGSPVTN
jgi:ribonuclease HI